MTSNLKRTLGGMLTLALVLSAAEARAQSLEKPGAPPAESATTAAAAAAAGPAAFGDAGQLAISGERMFGFTYTHQSYGTAAAQTATTFTLLSAPYGNGVGAYAWPRIGLDYFVARSFSVGGAASFYRTSSGGVGKTGFEVAPRLGYGSMVGPWLGLWGRGGVTFEQSSLGAGGQKLQYFGLSLEALAAIVVSPHFVVTIGPTLDLGLSGSYTPQNSATSESAKLTDFGVYVGLVIPI